MERLPVRSVNLGTGENGMHPEFKAILAYLRTKPVKLTITSNGHSVAVLKDDDLRAFHDIEFSLDYPTQKEQDAQRGEGNWELIEQQARRCVNLGVPVTIIAVMMKANYLRLAEVAGVAKKFDAALRINVYQAVRSDLYALTYEEYWEGFRRLLAETDVIAIGEPLVRAMAGLPPLQGGCGVSTVRVTPRATTQPCVYWPGSGDPLSTLISTGSDILDSAPFEQARALPDACQPCEFRESCHGGCAGRRRLQGALSTPDFYCPIIRREQPKLQIRMAANRDLPKLNSSCTTVVIARDVIRLAEPGDAELLPGIERSAGERFRLIPELAWIADGDDLPVEHHLRLIPQHTCWVAVDKLDRPIAFLSAEVLSEELHIWEISVRLEHQRAGIGRKLINHAIQEAKARGLAAVTLTTFRNVSWNEQFYTRLGFKTLDSREAGDRLSQILRAEIERGFPPERRCAMRLDIRWQNPPAWE
jgi:radical SAM protein with 4Fe4S-binding SPASM domain